MISDYNHGKGWRARQKLFRMSIQCIELTPSSFSVRQKQPRTILGRDSHSNYRQGKGWGEAQVHINRGHCKTKLLPRTIWKPSLIRDEEGELLLFLCDLSAFMGEFYSNLGDPNILTLWLIFLVPYYILDIMSLKVKLLFCNPYPRCWRIICYIPSLLNKNYFQFPITIRVRQDSRTRPVLNFFSSTWPIPTQKLIMTGYRVIKFHFESTKKWEIQLRN